MDKSLFKRQLIRLAIISGCVFLTFKYLLPLFFPFIVGYCLFRLLYPAMLFLNKKCHWPKFFSHYGFILFFWLFLCSMCSLLFMKIISQLELLLSNIPLYFNLMIDSLSTTCGKICSYIDNLLKLSSGTSLFYLQNEINKLENSYMSFSSKKIGRLLFACLSSSIHFFAIVLLVFMSTLILTKEIGPLHKKYRESIYFIPAHDILIKLKHSGLSYLRTEFIILIINWGICSLGLYLSGNDYFFIFGMFISIIDALPLLGSGTILVPAGIFCFFRHNYLAAAILLTTYIATLLVRELTETNVMGDDMGLNPFIMLIAIFTGLKLFGILGIFLGPMAVVLIKALL